MSLASISAPSVRAVALTLGGTAAAISLAPSISPRSKLQQGGLTAVSSLGGAAIGGSVAFIANKVATKTPGGAAALYGALTVGGFAAHYFTKNNASSSKPAAMTSSSGVLLATAGAAGLGVMSSRFLGRYGGAALALGVGALGFSMYSKSRKTSDQPSRVVNQAKISADKVSSEKVNTRVPLTLDTVSGGKNSLFALDELGKEGKNFVLDAVPAARIRSVMGTGVNPVRVYAPLKSADTPYQRVAIALQEAEKLGAFDGSRKQLIVATTTGSGYVDPPSIQAAEFMSKGKTATIALQYANKPSVQSTGEVPVGAQTTELMLRAIQQRINQMPKDKRPEVVLFGESLGAWAQQDAFKNTKSKKLNQLGVNRALWVGSPQESSFADQIRANKTPRFGEFDRIEEYEKLTPLQRKNLKYVLLTHNNDPVSHLNVKEAFYQRPDWLPTNGRKPNGIPQSMSFYPGITWGQGVVDLLNGTHPEPGKFKATSHDYRADLSEFVRVAYGHSNPTQSSYVSRPQMNRVTTELIRMEKERAARQK